MPPEAQNPKVSPFHFAYLPLFSLPFAPLTGVSAGRRRSHLIEGDSFKEDPEGGAGWGKKGREGEEGWR